MHNEKYIPAMGIRWLTPLYDTFARWGMREEQIKGALIRQAQITNGQRVLDVGCGTGTLAVMLKRAYPDAAMVGIDGDADILSIARNKARRAGLEITFDEGMAFALPYPDNSFDRVLSSLVFHHLTPPNKERASAEIFRILRPHGEFHILDIDAPHGGYASFVSHFIKHGERTTDSLEGKLPEAIRQGGFESVEETARFSTFIGTLRSFRAKK